MKDSREVSLWVPFSCDCKAVCRSTAGGENLKGTIDLLLEIPVPFVFTFIVVMIGEGSCVRSNDPHLILRIQEDRG